MTISGSDRSAAPAPSHGCIRCGAPIPLAEALCAACNPGGLEQPAASQAHVSVFAGIALAVVAMLVGATLLIGGVGPFTGRLTTASPVGLSLIHISEPTRLGMISYAVFCLK